MQRPRNAIWLFEKTVMEGLVSKLFVKATVLCERQSVDFLPLQDAVKFLSFYRVGIDGLLMLIDDGQMTCVIEPDERWLTALKIKKSDLERYMEARKEERRNEYGLTMQEAAKTLGVKGTVLKRWINRGLLKASTSGQGRTNANYIAQADIDKFREEYAFMKDVSRLLGVTVQTIANWAKQGKLRACSGPKINGGGRLLFKLSDMKQIESIGARKRAIK